MAAVLVVRGRREMGIHSTREAGKRFLIRLLDLYAVVILLCTNTRNL